MLGISVAFESGCAFSTSATFPRASFFGVSEVVPPLTSVLAPLYASSTLVDSFSVRLRPAHLSAAAMQCGVEGAQQLSVEQLARLFLEDMPWWFHALMRMRDEIMRPFGVKTSREIQQSSTDRILFCPVLQRVPSTSQQEANSRSSHSQQEIVLGERDSHLDFKISVMLRTAVVDEGIVQRHVSLGELATQAGSDDVELVSTTVVQCHGVFGRTYLRVIEPFHRFIVAFGLKQFEKKLDHEVARKLNAHE
jgi:hypothetical protein